MKKILLVASVLGLTACQNPTTRIIYQEVGPTQCQEQETAFKCLTPLQVWNETTYPKNEGEMLHSPAVVASYPEGSLSRAVYGN